MSPTTRPRGAAARRAQNREAMRRAILDVAGELVIEHGIDGLSIRELAKRLGYSAAAIYDYFDSREEILTWLYFEGTGGLDAEIRAALGSAPKDATAVDQLVAMAHAYRNHALSRAELYRLVFGGLKSLPVHQPHEQNIAFDGLIQIATNGVAEGDFIAQPIPLICAAAWAGVHGFVSLEITGHITGGPHPGIPIEPEEGRRNRDAMFATVVTTLVRGFASEAWLARNPPAPGNTPILPDVEPVPDRLSPD